jgi:RNA polymerase sigma-54 factor
MNPKMRLALRMIRSMEILQFPAAELREEVIRELDSNPALVFAESAPSSDTLQGSNPCPDVIVELADDSKWRVRIPVDDLTKLQISEEQTRLQRALPTYSKERRAVNRRIEQARWFIVRIEQRGITLKRIAQAIVDYQSKFRDKGAEHLVPLKMQQVADDVSVHVTTVYRAVDGKIIHTPHGNFSLKRFFGSSTQTDEMDDDPWRIICRKLMEIIDDEDKRKPLSDDALVIELAKRGVTVARRTATKFRKTMDSPSSRLRRQWRKY